MSVNLCVLCLVCLTVCLRGACVLTQVPKQLHSQRCKDKEEKHEEETQIPHLQRDNKKREREKDWSEEPNPWQNILIRRENKQLIPVRKP